MPAVGSIPYVNRYVETEAARTALASVVAELVGVLPKIGACRKASDFMNSGGWGQFETYFFCIIRFWVVVGGFSTMHLKSTAGHMRLDGVASRMATNVESQSGINLDAALALIKEARRVILVARGALF